jgi:hypothetical protein
MFANNLSGFDSKFFSILVAILDGAVTVVFRTGTSLAAGDFLIIFTFCFDDPHGMFEFRLLFLLKFVISIGDVEVRVY